jgi:hypothetical protein
MSRRVRRVTVKVCSVAISVLMMLLVLTQASSVFAEGEPGGGGIRPGELWVNARLGQPGGNRGGGGGGQPTGKALRYVYVADQRPCSAVRFVTPPGLEPWLGVGGDPNVNTSVVRALLVDRATNAVLQEYGLACLNPNDIVLVPTPAEILNAVRAANIPVPQVELSPSARGITGLETWYWFDTPNHVEVDLNLRGFTVRATADATFHWSTGDGQSYSTGKGGSEANPAVRHIYNERSESGKGYSVTLDMVWQGAYNWSGYGDAGSGNLGPVTMSGTRSYPVNEVRSVLQ